MADKEARAEDTDIDSIAQGGMDEGRTASMPHPRGGGRTPGQRYDAPACGESVGRLSLARYREEREVIVVARSLQNPKAPEVWRRVRERGSTLSLGQVRAVLREIYVRTETQRGHARSRAIAHSMAPMRLWYQAP
jgi:hypothetical protein